MRRFRAYLAAGAAALLLWACGDAAPEPVVRVWFTADTGLVAVERPAADPSLEGAVRALTEGPTAAERRRGLSSWFGEGTADVVRSVTVADGRAVIDFDPTLRRLMPGAASSAGSRELLSALDSTVFQFPWIRSVEYRLGGSCEAFWGWLQRECRVVRR